DNAVCLEKCTKTQPCLTAGFGCLFGLQTDPNTGKVSQLDTGACFKKDMKEGDNCAIPSSALCGLNCTGTGATEQCTPKLAACYFGTGGPSTAQCYSLCTTMGTAGGAAVACAKSSQKCTAL